METFEFAIVATGTYVGLLPQAALALGTATCSSDDKAGIKAMALVLAIQRRMHA